MGNTTILSSPSDYATIAMSTPISTETETVNEDMSNQLTSSTTTTSYSTYNDNGTISKAVQTRILLLIDLLYGLIMYTSLQPSTDMIREANIIANQEHQQLVA